MAAPDVLAIANAVAAGFGSLTPPTGKKAIGRSTAQPPNSIPHFPFVTVLLPDGELQIGPTLFTLNFQVRFWYAKHELSLGRDMGALLSWLGVLIMAGVVTVNTGVTALSQVKSGLASDFTLFVDTYGSVEAYGWEFTLPVLIRDWPLT